MNLRYNIFLLILFLLLSQGYTTLKSQPILNRDTVLNLSANANDSISVHYIGCSGFFIRKGNNVVLIDPYFSNKKGSSALFGKLTNQANISADLKNLIGSVFFHVLGDSLDHSGLIKTLLITHGHVDHYGDVPYLFHSVHLNHDSIKIIANTTTQYYLAGDSIPDKNIIRNVESSASCEPSEGKWIYVNNKIRVLPITSEHAPHFKIFGMNIYLTANKDETKNISHKYWRQYSAGHTLCYLIDFLNDDGSINLRMYINSAASNYPYGFPGQNVLSQHPVDIAMLCVAQFNNANNYPEAIVKYLKPKHIIACHWEKFLTSSIPELKKKPKSLTSTNVPKFFRRLDKVLLDLPSGTTYSRPNVNTTIKFLYLNPQVQAFKKK